MTAPHPKHPHDWIAAGNIFGGDADCARCGANSWDVSFRSECPKHPAVLTRNLSDFAWAEWVETGGLPE
ncbi:hypothetical protein FHY05_001656 [Sphingomonas sp. BK580]|nr:hypothetical protein [Sphingomonas sp. BK580]